MACFSDTSSTTQLLATVTFEMGNGRVDQAIVAGVRAGWWGGPSSQEMQDY